MRDTRKSVMMKLAGNICDLLEQGNEAEFFELLGRVLQEKIPFGSLKPLGEIIGKRGLEKPGLYFDILDKFHRKSIDYGYRKGIIDSKKMRMSEEEVQKSRVYGWRAGIIGIAFNEMSHKHHREVTERTREYIVENAHWSSSDTYADKAFNRMFQERFDWTLGVLKEWAKDDNRWVRNAAGFAIHAPVEQKILTPQQFRKALKVLDLLMQDQDLNVKKKVSWALRVVSKYYPKETYVFLKKWSRVDNENTRWIIKNGAKMLEKENQEELLRQLDNSNSCKRTGTRTLDKGTEEEKVGLTL